MMSAKGSVIFEGITYYCKCGFAMPREANQEHGFILTCMNHTCTNYNKTFQHPSITVKELKVKRAS